MNEVKGLYKVKDIKLADEGKKRIAWAESRMPVLMALQEKYSTAKPFKGYKIAGCLHVTKETAVLVKAFVACGAQVSWSGCNPLSTQDDVAAALSVALRRRRKRGYVERTDLTAGKAVCVA